MDSITAHVDRARAAQISARFWTKLQVVDRVLAERSQFRHSPARQVANSTADSYWRRVVALRTRDSGVTRPSTGVTV